MMKTIFRITVYILAFVLPITVLSVFGSFSGMDVMMGLPSQPLDTPSLPAPRAFDPTKPTVAILMGDPLTEVTDFMIPYEIFSATGAFNVYGVAVERRLLTLTGGLDVMPDYSLSQLDAMLGKSPDIIVTPAITDIQSPQNRLLLDWLRQQASTQTTLFFSICSGAEVLAAAGVLDGHTATTFWAEIDGIEKQYPRTNWVRGLRYVDDGQVITSAGVTSGIDAALHIVAARLGEDIAKQIADDLHYPRFDYVLNPQVEQYYVAPPDAIYLLNASFELKRITDGVLLYEGVGEIELASIFDTYSASFTTRTLPIAPKQTMIATRYGLHLFPRYSYANAPAIDRLIIPGADAYQRATAEITAWQPSTDIPLIYLHADLPQRFSFEAPLMDLARQQDIPTAMMAAKRIEYRSPSVIFEGEGLPAELVLLPLGLGIFSVVLLIGCQQLLMRLRSRLIKPKSVLGAS